MKRLFPVAALAFLFCAAHADDPFRDFDKNITADAMKPFARDIGGLLGSGNYHTGRILGFTGFDVGVRGVMQFEPSPGNAVLEKNGVTSFGFPWIQAEIGMPLNLEGFIKASSWNGMTISGGGIRWGLSKVSDIPYVPQLMLVASGDSGVHRSFSVTHFGFNAVLSWVIKDVTPTLGFGVDRTRFTVREAVDQSLVDSDVVVAEPRVTVGLTYRPAQFVYLSGAGNWLHGKMAVSGSVGVRF